MSDENELFGVTPQPRRCRPECERVYSAVLYLRSTGLKVYRGGRDVHIIGGQRVQTRALLERAGA